MEFHTIEPVFDADSEILILGSFPSVKSRETNFFYGHPQNRFWKVVSAVMGEECPVTIDEKKAFLLRNKIAVWDVIKSCDISGSSDSSIKNVTPNDLSKILVNSNVKSIFTNGNTAYTLFKRYNPDKNAVKLPSTSPANAAFRLEDLIEKWSILKKFYINLR
ncbi:MAG: DNA-deoxyinosine glycosylase [Firmicutes bacterium]|nr:DNA-deoxyinosine glycosylase [Bacillota bacterium]